MPPSSSKRPSASGRTGKVLLVDDQPELRRFLARYLTRAGFEILEAGDGIAAIALVARNHVDAVLSDVRMPRMDGLELLETLTKLNPRLPVVLMSASDEIAGDRTARPLGAFDFLSKPINPAQLLSAISRAVERQAGGKDMDHEGDLLRPERC